MNNWKLMYHLMPPKGWLNDPNGLCQFHGVYHIFYQYSPDDPHGGKKHWGHYTTKDFLHFFNQEIAISPDCELDKDGAYSGSAIIKDQILHLFYTGNIKFDGNYDYIYSGRGHYVNTLTSIDGIHFSDKRNVLKNEDYPMDMSCHVRDPKIFIENDRYYMLLGARSQKDEGCILIFQSEDLSTWSYFTRIESDQKFGYMWECPDLFEINQEKILILCPQGLEKEKYKYENIYQSGYFKASGTMEKGIHLKDFTELDHGFDFYAPQTFLDENHRRILIGWMGLPDCPYSNPTVQSGWQHALTLPRELKMKDGHLYQYPISETKRLRYQKESIQLENTSSYIQVFFVENSRFLNLIYLSE